MPHTSNNTSGIEPIGNGSEVAVVQLGVRVGIPIRILRIAIKRESVCPIFLQHRQRHSLPKMILT